MEGGKEGWREPSWGWEEPARWQEGPKGHAWVDGASSLPPKEKRSEAGSSSSCLCFPLRPGVLAIGLIGSTLALSGLVAYAIVQVPTLRSHLGHYFTNTTAEATEEESLRSIAYTSEIVGAVLGAALGLMANLLLVWGVLKSRRWFLVHWLLLHLLLVLLLFLTSILIFVVQLGLWKLMGLVPVLMALVTMFLWTKVYELFCQLRGAVVACKAHPTQPRPLPWPPEPEVPPQPAGPATVEFYPVDPLSRGMAERLKGWNMVCLPYQDQDSPYLGNWERSSHTYRRASESSSSSIVPGLVTAVTTATEAGEEYGDQVGDAASRTSKTDSRMSPAEI